MLNQTLQQYIPFAEFLSQVLGNDYTISLYDLSALEPTLITSFPQSDAMNKATLTKLIEKATQSNELVIHENILSAPNHNLSASCFLINKNDIIIGMLCIIFDDVKYRNICQQVLQLCHHTPFQTQPNQTSTVVDHSTFSKDNNVQTELVARDAAIEALHAYGVCASRLTSDERLEIIQSLDKTGIFLLKGAVKDVATVLECSSASVYRYLSQIRMDSLSM